MMPFRERKKLSGIVPKVIVYLKKPSQNYLINEKRNMLQKLHENKKSSTQIFNYLATAAYTAKKL